MARAFLLCRVGSRRCALALEHVVETMRPLPVAPVSGMPAFVLGLSKIRGAPTPVVDAGRLLGANDARPGRFVTMRAGGRPLALAVDGVVGVRTFAPSSLGALPPLLQHANTEVVEALGILDADLLFVLRSACIVPEAVWTVLDGEEAGA